MAMAMAFNVENLTNCVQNEHALWDLHAVSSEEYKELAWHSYAHLCYNNDVIT